MSSTPNTSSSLTIAAQLAKGIVKAHPEKETLGQHVGQRLIMDVAGICIAARHEIYVKAALSSFEQEGHCTVFGFEQKCGVEGAAFVNGIAAHGEDFDDTYEGGPVHAGVVIVPALLAAWPQSSLVSQLALSVTSHLH